VNVLNLVEGREVILESPQDAFEPFVVHYYGDIITCQRLKAYRWKLLKIFGEKEENRVY